MLIESPKQPGTHKGTFDLKLDIPGFQYCFWDLIAVWSGSIIFEPIPASIKRAFYGVLGRSNKNTTYESA